jgi:hypothetical protein
MVSWWPNFPFQVVVNPPKKIVCKLAHKNLETYTPSNFTVHRQLLRNQDIKKISEMWTNWYNFYQVLFSSQIINNFELCVKRGEQPPKIET